jgi:hypothetical protein
MLSQQESESKNAASNTSALRAALLGGQALEVAGYELAPELATAIDRADAAKLAPFASRVHWFEVVTGADRPPAPAVVRLLDAWLQQGVDANLRQVVGQQFWATQEISESLELIDATSAALAGAGATAPVLEGAA